MNQEEVIELMNRELDGDLSHEERGLLFQHLATSPDSQAMFTRLKNLSSKLEALPKVKPAFSIVDRILPTLHEIDQMEQETIQEQIPSKPATIFSLKNINYKKLWIPGSVIAAGLLITFMINGLQMPMDKHLEMAGDHSSSNMKMLETKEGQGDTEGEMNSLSLTLTNDEAIDEDLNNVETNNEETDQGTEGLAGTEKPLGEDKRGEQGSIYNEQTRRVEDKSETSQSDKPTEYGPETSPDRDPSEYAIGGSEATKEEENDSSIMTIIPEEEVIYVSPDGIYSAKIGSGDEDIMIDKEGRPHFLTSQSHWDHSWTLETIEWISNVELYYVIYHTEENERQYWLINAEERKETKLEFPIYEKEKE